MCCQTEGGWVQRHNLLRDALARIVEQATGVRPAKEVAAPHWSRNGQEAVLDLRVMDDDVWVDVTVAYPHMAAANARDGVAAEAAERMKRRRYPGARLTPCAVEAHGRYGEAFLAFLRALARHIDPDDRVEFMQSSYQALAAALHRGNAVLLHTVTRP